jgi:hypothetical protein
VSAMSHSDEDLIRLFAETERSLPPEEFLTQVTTRIGRARQRRMLLKLTLALVLVVAAAAATPFVAEGSLELGIRVVDGLAAFGAALGTPAGWACSILMGAWALRRAGVIGGR